MRPAQPIRVLRIVARLNVGGPAQHVVWLDEGLRANGFDPMLVTGVVPAGEDDMSAFARSRGVAPVVIPSMSRELSPGDLLAIWKLWRLMVRFQPDIVHTHTAKAGAVGRLAGLLYRFGTPAALAGRARRCRFVHTYHGHVFHSYHPAWKTRLFLAIERMLARINTDRLIVLGQHQLHEIRDTFGVGRRAQFVVVPLGIELAELPGSSDAGQKLRAALGIGRSERIVGVVGRLAPVKNHDLLLRVAAQTPGLTRFVIYGAGHERQRLESRAAGMGLANRVIFAGTQPAPDIYASLDVVALTSRNEGTPLALIEAMASGKPVISTAVGGVVDLLGVVEERVTDNGAAFEIRERGITAASGDTSGFAAGLSRLLLDEGLCGRLVDHGRTYVEKSHSKERLIADMIRLYRELTLSNCPGNRSVIAS